MWEYWPFIALAVLVVVCFIAIVVVGSIEKHQIHDFDPAGEEILSTTSPYFTAMNQAAQQLGFQYGGVFAQNRGKTYQCRLALWLTPDHSSLVAIIGGKVGGMNYRKTFMYSWIGEDKILVTLDEFGTADLSGMWKSETLLNADLPELQQKHFQRLSTRGGAFYAFTPTDLFQQFEGMARARVERMVGLGLAVFLDPPQNVWKYTFKGAWSFAVNGYLKGLGRASAQSHRSKKKRPGS